MKHAVRFLTLALIIAAVVATTLVRAQQGSLTAADKASVLKAFDAGVLRGPRP